MKQVMTVGALGAIVAFGAAAVSAQDKPKEAPQTRVYIIRQGDTLWDLAASQLNSPWYWPRIWHANPQITNPHRIMSGQKLEVPAFDPADTGENVAEAPEAKVQLAAATASTAETAAPAAATTEVAAVVEEEAPVEDVQEEKQPDLTADDTATMNVEQQLSGLPSESRLETAILGGNSEKRYYVRIGSEGFIAKEKAKAAASVVGSHSEKLLYGQHDLIFISLGEGSGVEVGQRFTAIRNREAVNHPKTEAFVGYRTQQLGVIEVTQVNAETATALVLESYDVIEKGSLLVPFEPYEKHITPLTTPESLSGTVVSVADGLDMAGEHTVIYVDQGTDNNLNVGQSFEIYHAMPNEMDVLTQKSLRVPDKIIGHGIVVDAGPSTSSVLVWNSVDVISKGDLIRPIPQ